MAERESAAGLGERSGRPVAEDARAMVRNMAEQQKHKVASRLGGVAQALHETAKTLERHNADVGRYADLAARQVDRVTEVLQERAVEDLVDDAENFARRQPMLFIGGAMAAGFLLARVVKGGEAAGRPMAAVPHASASAVASASVSASSPLPAGGLERAGGQP